MSLSRTSQSKGGWSENSGPLLITAAFVSDPGTISLRSAMPVQIINGLQQDLPFSRSSSLPFPD
jgi:hypothetical protein